jgi:hypothetical protein
MFTVTLERDGSGNSNNRSPLSSWYSVMPSTLVNVRAPKRFSRTLQLILTNVSRGRELCPFHHVEAVEDLARADAEAGHPKPYFPHCRPPAAHHLG